MIVFSLWNLFVVQVFLVCGCGRFMLIIWVMCLGCVVMIMMWLESMIVFGIECVMNIMVLWFDCQKFSRVMCWRLWFILLRVENGLFISMIVGLNMNVLVIVVCCCMLLESCLGYFFSVWLRLKVDSSLVGLWSVWLLLVLWLICMGSLMFLCIVFYGSSVGDCGMSLIFLLCEVVLMFLLLIVMLLELVLRSLVIILSSVDLLQLLGLIIDMNLFMLIVRFMLLSIVIFVLLMLKDFEMFLILMLVLCVSVIIFFVRLGCYCCRGW